MTPWQTLSDPNLGELLSQVRAEMFYNFNCHQLGRVVSFDTATQSASVQLAVLRMVPSPKTNPPQYVTKTYPVLVQVPVFIASGGTGRLTFPIIPGDPCLVLFNDRDIDNWWSTGNTAAPNTPRAHDLSDGLALVGFRNKANKIATYNGTDAELAYAGGRLTINDKVRLEGSTMSLKTLLTDVKAALTALDGKTGPSAATAIALVQTDITALLQ